MKFGFKSAFKSVLFFLPLALATLTLQSNPEVQSLYTKTEQMITMRDGVKLFTAIYAPKDQSQTYPILLNRTPYSVSPYGPNAYRDAIGPSDHFQNEKFIIVYQDVRGKFMSEGEWVEMRPYKPKKSGPRDIDETTDTYDTIEWLVKNVPNNNGRAGMWGISYPGFYTSMGVIDAHPALKAASPQAPIADWFIGDDFHHNGTLFLPHAFNFFSTLGKPRPKPTTEFPPRFVHGTPDGYRFFLDLGPLPNANTKYLKNEVGFWNDLMNHPNYDDYWQSRNIRPHLRNIKPAVMVVGGWFDAENLFGALNTYKTIESANPGARNTLVMGPWFHGGWARSEGDQLGGVNFGEKTSLAYRETLELPFFNCALKDKCGSQPPEATVFETGSNQWRRYDSWPPKEVDTRELYLGANGELLFAAPGGESTAFDEYVSDPAHPVPFINNIAIGMTREYMTDDQRFAATRPDVLVYQTERLEHTLTFAGPLKATLFVSTSGTDSDFVVKLIDVFPNDAAEPMGGYQMLVRGEPMRARFRNSYAKPEAMEPGKITKVEFTLPDINHAFMRGHRIMIQIQSSWFPLVDRNPQKFVDIYHAKDADFQKATQRVYRAGPNASRLSITLLR